MSFTKRTIYAIYASQDIDVLRRLLLRLHPLKKDFNLTIWSDDAINPGQRWRPEHESRLNHCDIFLLLLSNSFMYSDLIRQEEFQVIVDRYKNDGTTIIPIIIDNCPWDLEFSFGDYNFNFKELQVFPKNQKPLGDRNTEDVVFGEITNFLRGLISPPDKTNAVEENRSRSTAGQIAIDFFEEERRNDEAEKGEKSKREVKAKVKDIRDYASMPPLKEIEAKETVIIESRPRHKVEVQQRIKKEKELKGKAKRNTKIEVEAKLHRRPIVPNRENESAITRKLENIRSGIRLTQKGSIQDKEVGKGQFTQEKGIRKNRLERYNYQFKTTPPVKVKSVGKKESPDNGNASTTSVVYAKERGGMQKSGSANDLEKRLGEVITVQEVSLRKKRLSGHNYQFKTTQPVKTKRVAPQEEMGVDERQVKPQPFVEVKKQIKISKSESDATLKEKLAGFFERFRKTLKDHITVAYDRTSKSWSGFVQRLKEAKEKKALRDKKSFFSGLVVKIKGTSADSIAMLKKSFATAYHRTSKPVSIIGRRIKEAKEKRNINKESGFFSGFMVEWRKTLENSLTTLKEGSALAYDKTVESLSSFLKRIREAKGEGTIHTKGIYAGFAIASLVICGLLIYVFIGNAEKQSTIVPEVETTGVPPASEPTIDDISERQPPAISELGIGDTYLGGMVFAIDSSKESGKIAYTEDMGPMPWKDAIKIHEQLGEGWRLPTLMELEIMYHTIGQGATNDGRFADKLYWSATPYDKHQARLLRFTDGNTSYHYNNALEKRKFLVRAIRDFGR
ncbi:TIR domain-containing protein [Pareuzebyella sediminis]|uniref:TIR domain-containing protein n=1 Tax=Pareuzebyella sediminis TaxID=2607998 RepID=UPI0011EF9AE2|nr:TIR domain-containing protein [Pareuzebyella sediminis]